MLLALLLGACRGPAPSDPPRLEDAADVLVLPLFDSVAVPLRDGTGELRADDGVLLVRAGLTEWRVVEDLDENGSTDALVVVWSSGGGSGTFLELAHFVLGNGEGEEAVWSWRSSIGLGDRTGVRAVTRTGDRVELHLTEHGPTDPACCPTVEVVRAFTLVGGRLEPS